MENNVESEDETSASTDDQVVVVKLGSQILIDEDGHLDVDFLNTIAAQIAAIVAQGKKPVIVSSGAIACGRGIAQDMDNDRLSGNSLAERQALAAIGQAKLAYSWEHALRAHGLISAQLLLTNDDFQQRVRYLNLSATLRGLFEAGVIPVVNENDTIAIEELTLGDNDRLSAMLAGQLQAERLLILTDIAGVYDQDPRHNEDAQLLTNIEKIDSEFIERTGGDSGNFGRGGMRSKLIAAWTASEAGVPSHIAHGREPQVIERICAGESIGTAISSRPDANPDARRCWLALARRPEGSVHLDVGATHAIQDQGTSLLPVGITTVEGDFERGDTISIYDDTGTECARGLSNFSAEELQQIKGQRLSTAAETLGYILPKTAIHRENLLLVDV